MRFILIAMMMSGCEHLCTNYVDCDARVRALELKNKELADDNRWLRLYSCDASEIVR